MTIPATPLARPNARRRAPIAEEPLAPAFLLSELPRGQILTADAIAMLRRLPDRCVDLVILDPPYWKVAKAKWDHRWRTEKDYQAWCRAWFTEVARVCKRSASVYLFGYVRNLIHLVHDVLSLGFEFRQEITVDKGMKSVAGRKTSTYKQFPNTTETIYFFVYDAKPDIRRLLLERQRALGLSTRQINERLGVKCNGGGMWSLYAGDNVQAQVPTREMWTRLEQALDFQAPEDLKGFVFHPQMGLTNVWTDIDFYAESRFHPTQKPLPLIERLLLASSDPGHLVVDPFAGSGTTSVAARRLHRESLSSELDPQMAEQARARLALCPEPTR